VPPVLPQQESSLKDPDSDREVFRSAGSIVLSWAWLVVAVIILIDLAVQGRDHPALVTAVLIIAISAIVYGCAWRPRIVADSTGITLANPLRDHRVPWGAVTNVDVVHAVRVHCAPAPGSGTEKIIYSWAVQTSPSSARRAARRAGRTGQRPRLTMSRFSQPEPPPGKTPGYAQMPEPAKDALDRTSAEYTAGRLAERAQHARQASAMRALADAAQLASAGPADGAGPVDAAGERPVAADAAGERPVAADAASEQPVAVWAWGPIAAMVAPIVILILVVLL
jgi:hypothetical protein